MVSKVIQFLKSKRLHREKYYTLSWLQKSSSGWLTRTIEFKAADVAHVQFGNIDFGPFKPGAPFFDLNKNGGPNMAVGHDHDPPRSFMITYWALQDGCWMKFCQPITFSEYDDVPLISSVTLEIGSHKIPKYKKEK